MLDPTQEGFRPGRGTSRQLAYYLGIIEDAHLSKQDIYSLYVDFSSAFNTIGHEQLMYILDYMKYPEQIKQAIKQIYTEPETKIDTPYGETNTIPLGRGTIQGDTLSPLIFLIFLDPLLKWIKLRGTGYQCGISEHHATVQGFADDLNCVTNNLQDLKNMINMIADYADWGGLEVNIGKCAVTAALCKTSENYQSENLYPKLKGLKFRENDSTTIPVLQPNEAYKYLGIWVKMNFEWDKQAELATNNIKIQGNKLFLNGAYASIKQKYIILASKILPGIMYHLATVPYTQIQRTKIMSAYTQIAKRIAGLHTSTASVICSIPRAALGLGCAELQEETFKKTVHELLEDLRDVGPLGHIIRGLYNEYLRRWGNSAATYGINKMQLDSDRRKYPMLAKLECVWGDYFIKLVHSHKITNITKPSSECLAQYIMEKREDKREKLTQPEIWALNRMWKMGAYDKNDIISHDGKEICNTLKFERRIEFNRTIQEEKKDTQKALNIISLAINGLPQTNAKTYVNTQTIPERKLNEEDWTHASSSPSNSAQERERLRLSNLLRRHQKTTTILNENDSINNQMEDTCTKVTPKRKDSTEDTHEETSHEAKIRIQRHTISKVTSKYKTYGNENFIVHWEPKDLTEDEILEEINSGMEVTAKIVNNGNNTTHIQITYKCKFRCTAERLENEPTKGIYQKELDKYQARPNNNQSNSYEYHTREQKRRKTTNNETDEQYNDSSSYISHQIGYANKIQIETESCNPDKDINKAKAKILSKGKTFAIRVNNTVHINQANGKWLADIQHERLQLLWKRYTKRNNNENTEDRTNIIANFLEEVVELLRRNKMIQSKKESNRGATKNQWATPTKLLKTIVEVFAIENELFASALNFTGLTKEYYSAQEEDHVFGAKIDAYSQTLQGSYYINPEYFAKDMNKAVKWAVMSVEATEKPTLCVVVVPHHKKALTSQ